MCCHPALASRGYSGRVVVSGGFALLEGPRSPFLVEKIPLRADLSTRSKFGRYGLSVDPTSPSSWHDVDSFLALVSTVRYHRGLTRTVGQGEEGLIFV